MRTNDKAMMNEMNEAMNLLADIQSKYAGSERTAIFKSCIKSNYENAESVDVAEFISEMVIGLRSLKKNL